MKILYLLLAVALCYPLSTSAQTEALHQFIETHKNDPGFTFAYLSQDLFEVVSHHDVKDKDWKKLQRLVRNIGSLRVLAADDIRNGKALYADALFRIPTSEFDELVTVNAEGTKVRIWAKDDGSTVTDLVLLAGSPETFVLICFTGAIDLRNVSELSKLFRADAAADLVATTKAASIDFQISPNPNDGRFALTYSATDDAPAALSVADQNGRMVYTQRMSGASSEEVNLPDLPDGVYWVQVKTGKGKVGVKEVVVRRG